MINGIGPVTPSHEQASRQPCSSHGIRRLECSNPPREGKSSFRTGQSQTNIGEIRQDYQYSLGPGSAQLTFLRRFSALSWLVQRMGTYRQPACC